MYKKGVVLISNSVFFEVSNTCMNETMSNEKVGHVERNVLFRSNIRLSSYNFCTFAE